MTPLFLVFLRFIWTSLYVLIDDELREC
jgi:hypothetical protein